MMNKPNLSNTKCLINDWALGKISANGTCIKCAKSDIIMCNYPLLNNAIHYHTLEITLTDYTI